MADQSLVVQSSSRGVRVLNMSAVPAAEAKAKGPRQKLISQSQFDASLSPEVTRNRFITIGLDFKASTVVSLWVHFSRKPWWTSTWSFSRGRLPFITRPRYTTPSHKDQSRKSTGRFRGDSAQLLTSLSLQKIKILAFMEMEPYFVQMSTKT